MKCLIFLLLTLQLFGNEAGINKTLALEEKILNVNQPLSEEDYVNLRNKLGAAKYKEREAATKKLIALGYGSLQQIKNDIAAITDPEISERLKIVIEELQKVPSNIKTLKLELTQLYAENLDYFWENRAYNLPDKKSKLFFSSISEADFLKRMQDADKSKKLPVLLKLIYYKGAGELLYIENNIGGSGYTRLVDYLRTYNSDEIIKITNELWPLELRKTIRNGSYYWTYRATSFKDQDAVNVIEMSIDKDRNRIVHFNVFKSAPLTKKQIGPLVDWGDNTRSGVTLSGVEYMKIKFLMEEQKLIH